MKIFKILFLILISLAFLFYTFNLIKKNQKVSAVRAFGDLTVDFGLPWVPPDGPIFTLNDFKPGDCTSRTITVTNDGQKTTQVAVKGIKTGGIDKDGYFLENALGLVIKNSTKIFYQGNLENFFIQSKNDGILLDLLSKNVSQTYNFEVCFPSSYGNEYQKLSVIFDITFGNLGDDRRLTGGGSFLAFIKGVNTRVTYGFELHCDPQSLPNNLEINWGKKPENNFHLTFLTSARCFDDSGIGPENPKTSFDTYSGTGKGRLNNQTGAVAAWTFTDAGEPGKNDTALISIKDKNGNLILNLLTPVKLTSGNHQAHK